jgi:putative phosphoesterase
MSALQVLVVSDTHLRLGAQLPDAVLQLADRADHVIHAGDLTSRDVEHTLAALAPLTVVHGNVDDAETVGALDERAQVVLGGVRVGIVHDAGPARGRCERLAGWFPDCDVVIYGHSHMPELERRVHPLDSSRTLLVLNPGSPTQRRRAPSHTVAWLELHDGDVTLAELVHLDGAAAR